LTSDHYGWLTTVAKSGQPVPRLIWFYVDGAAVFIYSVPGAAKVAHIQRHPRVSLNLDSDGNGSGIVVTAARPLSTPPTWTAATTNPIGPSTPSWRPKFGLSEAMASYSTRLRIGIDKVWTTPTEG
jgi:PPOX class probable F420-dependent enzyme